MSPSIPQLVYVAFGPEIYQKEAVFSISSAICMRDRLTPGFNFGIQIFTDRPSYFDSLPVQVLPIDSKWRGPSDYKFRVKHAVVREILNRYEQAAFIDSDTFFKKSPANLFERIKPGQVLCNFFGDKLKHLPAQDIFQAASVLTNVNKESKQTNSGVIGVSREDIDVLDKSLSLMDELYPRFPDFYTLEELCLALAASQKNLMECSDVLHHYWSRKGIYRAKVQAWLSKHGNSPLNTSAMEDVARINDRLPKPLQPLRAIQKLTTLGLPKAHRQFCRELLYGCHSYENEYDRACAEAWFAKAEENLAERRSSDKEEACRIIKHPLFVLLAGEGYKDVMNYFQRNIATQLEAEK